MSSNAYLNDQSAYAGNRLVAFFPRREDAYRAIEALRDAGYTNNEIGYISQEDLESGTSAAPEQAGRRDKSFWQSVKDFFSGDSHDEYDYNQTYPQAVSDLGWSTDRVEYYRHGIGSGGALVTVTGARSVEARAILESNGGDLRESGFDLSRQTSSTDIADRARADQRIQLRGERLRTFKERVQRGEVRLRKEVVTENQTVSVPVTREELVIERTRPTGETAATGEIAAGDEIRVPVSEERVHVEKQPVVEEEVRVGKRQVQRAEQVSDQVRHEELRIDKDGDVDVNAPGSRERKRKDSAA